MRIATGDTEFVRLTLNLAMKYGVEPASLVHALQNHDEMTYELVHFETLHARDTFTFRSKELTGHELAVTVRQDLLDHLTGDAAPYNATFTQNGIASTTATIIAAVAGHHAASPSSHPNRWSRSSRRTCCWRCSTRCSQGFSRCPVGICAGCSRWTAGRSVGCSPMGIPAGSTARRTTSWTIGPHAHESLSKMPRGISLYGSLPAQLQDSSSFARRLAEILAVRKRYGIASSVQLDVPQVSNKAMLVMVHQLSDAEQVTVLELLGTADLGQRPFRVSRAGQRVGRHVHRSGDR